MSVVGTNAPEAPVSNNSAPQSTQAQAPVNPPVAAKPEAKKEAPAFGKQFSALSRKEKELREAQKAFEAEKTSGKWVSKDDFKRQAKLDPKKALEELGLDYDYITNFQLDGKIPDQTKREVELNDQLNELRREIAGLKGEKPVELSPEEAAVNKFVEGIDPFIESNNEKYKLVHRMQESGLVYEFLEQIYAQTVEQGKPRLPSYDEGADLAEKYLQEQLQEIATMFGYSKPAADGKQPTKPQSQSGSQSSQTLSNELNQTSPSTGQPKNRFDPEELIQRAAAKLRHT
jgi:hypothetical protein